MWGPFLILTGGGMGALLRYWVSGLVYRFTGGLFPWGTMGVNVAGSFLIGLFWGLFEEFGLSPKMRGFLFIGLLGGFTTFSTYSLETFELLRDGEWGMALSNVVLSNLGGLLAVFAGLLLSRYITGVFR